MPRYQTMRGSGSSAGSAGTATASRRDGDREGARGLRPRAITELRHRRSSTTTAASRSSVHPRMGADRHPSGRWVDFENDYKTMDLDYMESVMWAFKQLWDKGLIYEAYRVMPYSWGAETPLSNFEIRLDDATRPRQDPAITVAFDLEPAAGDPGPMRSSPGPPRRGRCPPTWPSRSARRRLRDRRARRTFYVLGAEALANYEPSSATRRRTHDQGRELVGRPTSAASLLRRPHRRVPHPRRRFRRHLRGHRHRPHGARLRRGRPSLVRSQRDPIGRAYRSTTRAGSPTTSLEWAGENVFDANPEIIRHLKDSVGSSRHDTYEHNYPHCWRTDTPDHLQGHLVLVRRGHRIRDRLVELNQEINWVPTTSATAASACGSRAPATGRSAATGSGARRSRSGERRPRVSPDRRLRQPRRDSRPTSACGPTTCTARSSTSSPARTPTTPRGESTMRGTERFSTAGSSPARCPTPRSTTRSRTRSGSKSTSRPTSSSSTSTRRAAGSTRCTCSPALCSTSPRSRT